MLVKSLVRKILGSRNERVLRRIEKNVAEINALEPAFNRLTDEQLKAKTTEFKTRLQQGEKLDALLPEAFATVREVGKRVFGMRHFDVQLIGGIVLHQGNIAEMRTGEGKTLMATLPVYLNALTGKGVHVITVNDYLAKRDAHWMAPIYSFLGLTVGVNVSQMPYAEKKAAYAADITYGTNNEFGFDYLRDNMAFSISDKVQRELNFAIVDEVDSILIDEARTPLIISGQAEESSELYQRLNRLISQLTKQESEDKPADYTIDEKIRQAYLTEQGHDKVEKLLAKEGLLAKGESLYAPKNIGLMHHLLACLRAHSLFQSDVDYIVQNDEVVIVDEHTGRTMPGRRWSDGLHQAIEAKEGVRIQNENQTLASITFQNYFRLYDKLSGMTGTADTEAYEFQQIYGLEVVVIPTNKAIQRKDSADQIYLTAKEKFAAIIQDIKASREKGQPILVGTIAIESSEYLAKLLQQEKIPHQVLNAKYHEKEAQIIAEAGRPGAVTIATNMAGRGTDIVLGGSLEVELSQLDNPTEQEIADCKAEWQKRHDQVIKAGGLHIMGTERHESRRIDNQLRGRSGRQGDPGSSRFYLSLQDNLMRIFASDRVAAIMQRLGLKEGESIEHPWVSKAIENAQRKVEGHNFDMRKQLLEFDDVANDQRKEIYALRNEYMAKEDVADVIQHFFADVVGSLFTNHVPTQSLEEQWDITGLEKQLESDLNLQLDIKGWLEKDHGLHEETLYQRILEQAKQVYGLKEQQIGSSIRQLEKSVLLQNLDMHWREHLAAMEHLRQGIHLRGYAQKNPKQEYKRESFLLFSDMLERFKHDVVSILSTLHIQTENDVEVLEAQRREAIPEKIRFEHAEVATELGQAEAAPKNEPYMRDQPKVGRNEPCPCGSGKKYKQCHGAIV
ncbi:MAG: preprotein translocase, SecA subunit [Gammaproteobacteria bacterium]|jgi:preprotein translocase subunit SecA|nr:preprotein translocase, SecA subunit [Gammaproteobacteria bacterium]